MDVVISKPRELEGYTLHRAVAEMNEGRPALWLDQGNTLRIRQQGEPVLYPAGTLLGFTTTACVTVKRDGRKVYLPKNDWQGRRRWLEGKGRRNGFEVIACHLKPGFRNVEKNGKAFAIDATEFTGLIKVTDSEKFAGVLGRGLGATGKFYGLNMLIVN